MRILLILFTSFVGCSSSHWIKDPVTGCEVFNLNPSPNEYIRYEGPCSQGRAEGRGSLAWYSDSQQTSIYHGQFLGGKLHGPVVVTYYRSLFARFEGTYVEGYKHGPGKYFYTFGKTLSASWNQGKMSGEATIAWPNGKSYVGQTIDTDVLNGQGTMMFSNGDRYVGSFANDERTGLGEYFWTDGCKLLATFSADSVISGSYVWPSGDTVSFSQSPGSSDRRLLQPTIVRSGLLSAKNRISIGDRLSKMLVFPPELLRLGMEFDLNAYIHIDTVGAIKSCEIATTSIYRVESADPRKQYTITQDQLLSIRRSLLTLTLPVTSEEGRPFDVWVRIPLRYRFASR